MFYVADTHALIWYLLGAVWITRDKEIVESEDVRVVW